MKGERSKDKGERLKDKGKRSKAKGERIKEGSGFIEFVGFQDSFCNSVLASSAACAAGEKRKVKG